MFTLFYNNENNETTTYSFDTEEKLMTKVCEIENLYPSCIEDGYKTTEDIGLEVTLSLSPLFVDIRFMIGSRELNED